MNEIWESLGHNAWTCKGLLQFKNLSSSFRSRLSLTQLYNGRLGYVFTVEEPDATRVSSIFDRGEDDEDFEFLGETDDGHKVKVQHLQASELGHDLATGELYIKGFVQSPSSVEIALPTLSDSIGKVEIEITNFSLTRSSTRGIQTKDFRLEIHRSSNYKKNSQLSRSVNSSGIFSKVIIHFRQIQSPVTANDLVFRLAGILSIAHRSHVWPASINLYDSNHQWQQRVLQEPVFDLRKAQQPLIPEDALHEFIQTLLAKDNSFYSEWHFGEIQDYYLQAVSLTSAWPQAISFFTALEALKSSYVTRPENTNLDRYVSQNQFKKVADKVLQVLQDNFDIFRELLDKEQLLKLDEVEKAKRELEILTLKSKVGELNRPAYKMVLRHMFKSLNVNVDEQELNQLVNLRNQIIHSGTPEYDKSPWTDPVSAHIWICKFAALVEKIMLSILGYAGPTTTYDTIVSHSME